MAARPARTASARGAPRSTAPRLTPATRPAPSRDPERGCGRVPPDTAACDDGNACNGTDACQGGVCTHSGALPCAPIDTCHAATCDPTLGCQQTALNGASCDDGNACN